MNQIFRCSAAAQELLLPGAAEDYEEILASYRQGGSVLLRKTKSDMSLTDATPPGGAPRTRASWQLTSEETAAFSDRLLLFLQIQRLRSDGVQDAGEVHEIDVIDVLDPTIL